MTGAVSMEAAPYFLVPPDSPLANQREIRYFYGGKEFGLHSLDLIYYIDWSGLEDFDYDFDDEHVPRVDYGGELGLQYNPITISQWGLKNLQDYARSRDDRFRLVALQCARWLVQHAEPWAHHSSAWIYRFGHPLYGPEPPWISGMAQGEAVSLLLRCYQVEPDPDFFQCARSAILPFLYPHAQDGVADTINDDGDSIWFQEYPVSPPVHVLNGGIFALWGVYDYAIVTEDDRYEALWRQAVQTLKNHWQRWDAGFWTLYDLYAEVPRLASPMYHELHIRQLRACARMFDEPVFADVAKRWRRLQLNPLHRLRWGFHKIAEKRQLRGRV